MNSNFNCLLLPVNNNLAARRLTLWLPLIAQSIESIKKKGFGHVNNCKRAERQLTLKCMRLHSDCLGGQAKEKESETRGGHRQVNKKKKKREKKYRNCAESRVNENFLAALNLNSMLLPFSRLLLLLLLLLLRMILMLLSLASSYGS